MKCALKIPKPGSLNPFFLGTRIFHIMGDSSLKYLKFNHITLLAAYRDLI